MYDCSHYLLSLHITVLLYINIDWAYPLNLMPSLFLRLVNRINTCHSIMLRNIDQLYISLDLVTDKCLT